MPVNMKDTIVDAYLNMSKKKSADRITVTDLVEACSISRQSFYYHFQDIIEVIQWTIQREVDRAAKLGMKSESQEEAIKYIILAIEENFDLIARLLHSRKREYIEEILHNSVKGYLQDIVRAKMPEMSVKYSDAHMALKLYAYGIVGVLLEHCEDKQLDAETLSRQFCSVEWIKLQKWV